RLAGLERPRHRAVFAAISRVPCARRVGAGRGLSFIFKHDEERDLSEIIVFEPGGYRYIKGVFQYSAGVAAESGFAIVRARLARPLPLLDGFTAVESHLKA